MPSIYIRPVRLGDPALSEREDASDDHTLQPEEENQPSEQTAALKLAKYTCPVFMNRSRQNCAFTLELSCPDPVEKWIMAGTALILDPGRLDLV